MERLKQVKTHHIGIGGAILILLVVGMFSLLSTEKSFANANLARVSVGNMGVEGNSNAFYGALSYDGKYAVFNSYANNLVSGDTNNTSDIFVREQETGTVTRISVNEQGEGGNQRSEDAHISRDGRFVVFESYASNLTEPTETDWIPDADIFLFDREMNKMRRVSEVKIPGENYGQPGSLGSYDPFVSTSEDEKELVTYVAFMSYANNLVQNDANNHSDIYLYKLTVDKETGIETEAIVKVTPEYYQHGAMLMNFGNAYFPYISGNNRYITYTASSKTTYGNPVMNVYVFDILEADTEIISLTLTGKVPTQNSSMSSISDDGRYVAFSSFAILTSEDKNKVDDVYIRDRVQNVTKMVKVPAPVSGSGQYYGASNQPDISSGGRFVTFTSLANNLVPGDTNGVADVFVYDTVNKTFEMLSRNADAPGNKQSYRSAFSGDGKLVIFESDATNLIFEDTNLMRDVFVATPETTEANQDFEVVPEAKSPNTESTTGTLNTTTR